MKKVTAIFLLLFFYANGVLTQIGQEDSNYMVWYNEAEKLYALENPTAEDDRNALGFYKKTAAYLTEKDINDSLHADCLIKAANIYQGMQNYEDAINLYLEALSLNAEELKSNLINYFASLYLGSAYYFSNTIDSAKIYFEKADVIARKETNMPDKGFLYNSLGIIYYESANYIQAKNYFEKSLAVTDSTGSDYTETVISFKSNIATCYKLLNMESEAIEMYDKLLLQIDRQQPAPSFMQLKYKVSYNAGNCYFNIGNYDSALKHYENMEYAEDLFTVKKLNDIGRIYAEKGEWQIAETFFDSAIAVNKKVFGNIKNRERAYSFLYKCVLAHKQHLIDEAIYWCNYALKEIHFDFDFKDMTDLPADEEKVLSPVTFFEILHKKAELIELKYSITHADKYARCAVNTYMLAIKVAHFIKKDFDNDEAKLFFNAANKSVYHQSVDLITRLMQQGKNEYAENLILAMEDYKGSIIFQNLQKIEIKDSININPQVISREKELKDMLAFYYTRVNNNMLETEVEKLHQKITDIEIELSRLQKQYEKYPQFNYYKNQYSPAELTLNHIQENLDNETVILNFLVADTTIYAFALSSENIEVIEIKADALLKGQLDAFIAGLYNQADGKRYDGYYLAQTLYTKLLQPLEHVTRHRERLVVMPDGILNYLSFEALQQGSDKQYLALEKIVTYHYSISLLLQKSKEAAGEKAQQSLVFAPFSNEADPIKKKGLPVLYGSIEETKKINGKSYTAERATKQTFLEQAPVSSIIHLATHANANTDSFYRSCIMFYPADTIALNSELYLSEIYNLDLKKTSLVVLSACETAGGINADGEGLLSISRAFLYAGSNGIVSTLWKTEDHVTAWIMQRFHEHLATKNSPDKALFLAKKDFLENSNFDEHYKTPNYWSNFMYVGIISPIEKSYTAIFALITICLAGLFYFIQYKYKH